MATLALIANFLHHKAMVGYNRYAFSLGRSLCTHVDGELVWVPLPSGVHPELQPRLPGRIASEVRRGIVPGTLDWLGAERRVRPVLWHVLTDTPVPLLVRRPIVVTCHGLPRWLRHRHMIRDGHLKGRLWDYQDYPFRPGLVRGLVQDWVTTKIALLRATAIVAVSEYVRWELVHKFGIQAQKVHVVYLAPDPVFCQARSLDAIEAVRQKYGLPSGFVLGVASYSRTKNTEGLLRLAVDLAAAGLPPMVLIGPAGAMQRYMKLAEALGLVRGRSIFMFQNIPDEELACMYRAASVFVNLAWEESFGLPLVEAMASGTPVIGSNRTAVPEVIGSGGLVVDPADPEAVFQTVRRVLTDESEQNDLRKRALRRAADFSWDKAARQVITIYEQVLGQKIGKSLG